MARVLVILIVIALLVWGGEAYFSQHPAMGIWDSMTGGSNSSSGGGSNGSASNGANGSHGAGGSGISGASPSATPDHTVATCREALWKQTETLLKPLDQNKDFSRVDTTRVLQQTERDLLQYRSDPAYGRLTQACSVLAQVMGERETFLQRYARDSATPTPAAPSSMPLQTSTLQPSYDLKPLGTNPTTFFRDRVADEWHQRCAYYEPILDNLLIATN